MSTSGAWRRLDAEQAARISAARIELHWALQIASAAAAIGLPPRTTGLFESVPAHPSFGWSSLLEGFVGPEAANSGLAVGLRIPDLALLVLQNDEVVAAQPLAGRTLAQGLRWIAKELADRGGPQSPKPLGRPPYAMPDHPVEDGAAFTGDDGASLAALGDWFTNAQHALTERRAEHEHLTELRVWPQRCDLSMQILLDPSEPPNRSRTVTVGMTPGDSHTPVPYFFVSPSPCPAQQTTLPALPDGGRWNIGEWTGALLPATALSATPQDQREEVQFFLQGAIGACRALLRR